MYPMSEESTGERDVLGSLPRTRPARRSSKRDAPAAATPSAAPKAKPRTKPEAKAKARAKVAATPKPPATPRRSAGPPPPASGYAVPEPDPQPPAGDLLSTTVEAVGELAQLGLRALRSVLHRGGE
jgi:hypothetical protein